jgi:hypothetical protein
MTPEEEGLLALATLEKAILELRTFYDQERMPDAAWVGEEWAPAAAQALKNLDLYLTGKIENRNPGRDLKNLDALANQLDTYIVYLSDGGYSRLVLRPEDGRPVSLDRGLSLPRVVARWDALR